MDDLEKRLREDATAIRADASDELKTRIDASLHAARAMRQEQTPKRERHSGSGWWLSSLTGVAMAVAVLVFLNRESVTPVEEETIADTPEATSTDESFLPMLPLKIQDAHLTDSLEQELKDLQSDLERAREAVEEDMRKAF